MVPFVAWRVPRRAPIEAVARSPAVGARASRAEHRPDRHLSTIIAIYFSISFMIAARTADGSLGRGAPWVAMVPSGATIKKVGKPRTPR